ncbi:formyltetrahydrofolate deformylase [Demequina litorisediminis]|uniref:Formyltetrahydrofolate deformylase n=1 Tax=Demequina litorisediminis TaxID=1849022 RepID=A0ABQ6IGF8_9MICO|nr:formyltetrahydrofolate deformylase [Demequina litorisediminis]
MTATDTRYVLSLSCPDGPGIVHAVSGALASLDGNITESQQFGDPDTGLFFMRVEVTSPAPRDQIEAAVVPLAARFGMDWKLDVAGRAMRTLVLVSKSAHCVNDLLFRERARTLPIDIVAVAGNHATLAPLAAFYGKEFHHVPVTAETKPAAEARLLEARRRAWTWSSWSSLATCRSSPPSSRRPCAGAPSTFTTRSCRPSRAPAPTSRHTTVASRLIGATAHYVTSDLDEGPIIEQEVERVDHTHTPESLTAVGADVERRALARAVRWHAEHRVLLDGHRTIVFR